MPMWSTPRRDEELSIATRSPGRASAGLTATPTFACSDEVRGRSIPFLPNTYCTNPLQSNPAGVVPPHLYGTPRYCLPVAMTASALEVSPPAVAAVGAVDVAAAIACWSWSTNVPPLAPVGVVAR